MMLTEIDHLPEGLLNTQACDLHRILPGPTLIHLPGRRPEPLFVSVLLHGNEDTGLLAVQSVLAKYLNQELPRALSLFIGNIAAAREGVRRLDNQPDYNRVWPGSTEPQGPEHMLMQQIVNIMAERKVFASIDIHNNTGLNPHYACVNRLDHAFFHLARLFSRTVVYFTTPKGVQSEAFAANCPAVTVECGKPGGQSGVEHAITFVDAALHLSGLPAHPLASHEIDLFHTVAVVKVPEKITLSIGDTTADLCLEENIDHLNFRELEPGTRLGLVSKGCPTPLHVLDDNNQEVSSRYFEVGNGQLLTRRAAMPAMLTRDTRIIRQDCLCYLMERLPWQELSSAINAKID
jgi:succinylglutamate desuccinylase